MKTCFLQLLNKKGQIEQCVGISNSSEFGQNPMFFLTVVEAIKKRMVYMNCRGYTYMQT